MAKRKATRKPSPSVTNETELKYVAQLNRDTQIANVITTLGKWAIAGASLVGFGYVAIYLPVEASAGQDTTIDYAINWISDLKLDVLVGWSLAAGAGVWGYYERRQRHKEKKAYSERRQQFEESILKPKTSEGNHE